MYTEAEQRHANRVAALSRHFGQAYRGLGNPVGGRVSQVSQLGLSERRCTGSAEVQGIHFALTISRGWGLVPL
jgi:hypothetical protein